MTENVGRKSHHLIYKLSSALPNNPWVNKEIMNEIRNHF